MTAIVGIREDGHVYLGADSSQVGDNFIASLIKPKLFRKTIKGTNQDLICAYAGDFRVAQVVEYCLEFPEDTEASAFDYLVRKWIPAFKSSLRDGGVTSFNPTAAGPIGFGFIMGYRESLMVVQNDYAVLDSLQPYTAYGSGEHYSLGSLATTQQINDNGLPMSPELRLQLALHATLAHSPNVKEPFGYESV